MSSFLVRLSGWFLLPTASIVAAYRLPLPKDAPFTIGYPFEGKPHDYLPDAVGKLSDGKLFIAEAGKASGISRSTLSRLVQRTKQMGQVACIPHGSYMRQAALHPAFQECIRRLFLLPTRLSMTAIHEHTEMRQVAAREASAAGQPIKLPSYDQVRREVHRLKEDPELVAVREEAKSLPRLRESPQSFALSIPSPALLKEGSMNTRSNCMS
jgi:hypothetical protein